MKTLKYKTNDELINHAIDAIAEKANSYKGEFFTQPDNTYKFLLLNHKQEKYETFSVIFLTSKNELIEHRVVFNGSINSAQIYPRTIAQIALELNAKALILCHHHPSGETTPSMLDLKLTDRLIEVMRLIDVKILDHFILGGKNFHSMAINGQIKTDK